LLEAQASGLPCISFDCDTGPRHIITPDTGVLVEKENPQALAAAVSSIIENEVIRYNMQSNAVKNVQRFSPEVIYEAWQQKALSL